MLLSESKISETIMSIDNIDAKLMEILAEDYNFEAKTISLLNSLVSEKTTLIQRFDTWAKSDDGKSYIATNNEEFSLFIKKKTQESKKIADNIQQKLDKLKSELEKVNKNKNLRVYNK